MFKLVLRVDFEAILNDIGLLSWPDPNGWVTVVVK